MYSKIKAYIEGLDLSSISPERKKTLQPLIDFIKNKRSQDTIPAVNFICTHNSRRSQLAQVWAQTIADFFGIEIKTYSGGVEVTAFHPNGINTLEKTGFLIEKSGENNPKVAVYFADDKPAVITFSKKYDDAVNPESGFAAVMTCSHADETCPFIAGAEKRIPIMYEDPKEFDGTSQETDKYEERSRQIATEMKYIFSAIKK